MTATSAICCWHLMFETESQCPKCRLHSRNLCHVKRPASFKFSSPTQSSLAAQISGSQVVTMATPFYLASNAVWIRAWLATIPSGPRSGSNSRLHAGRLLSNFLKVARHFGFHGTQHLREPSKHPSDHPRTVSWKCSAASGPRLELGTAPCLDISKDGQLFVLLYQGDGSNSIG